MRLRRGRKDEITTAGTLDSFYAKLAQPDPLQRRILNEMRDDLIEWTHKGVLVRGRATGELLGPEVHPLLVNTARFVLAPDGSDVYEYPTRVLADGGRIVEGTRSLPPLIEFMLDQTDLDRDTKAAVRQVIAASDKSDSAADSS